jgi:RNA polymerase primary sigma factor
MTVKIDETVKLLADEGRAKGFLTFAEMNKLLEDKFVPPDKMDQIFAGLEKAGIEIMDGEGRSANAPKRGKDPVAALPRSKAARPAAGIKVKKRTAKSLRGVLPEKIDDPVRMYLTQMGEIPLLTRPEEIFLAKSIEITR